MRCLSLVVDVFLASGICHLSWNGRSWQNGIDFGVGGNGYWAYVGKNASSTLETGAVF
jgi:hypothetical protein